MSVEVPNKTNERLREAKAASDKLVADVGLRRNVWSKDQEEQISLFYDMIKGVHDALSNLVDANQ